MQTCSERTAFAFRRTAKAVRSPFGCSRRPPVGIPSGREAYVRESHAKEGVPTGTSRPAKVRSRPEQNRPELRRRQKPTEKGHLVRYRQARLQGFSGASSSSLKIESPETANGNVTPPLRPSAAQQRPLNRHLKSQKPGGAICTIRIVTKQPCFDHRSLLRNEVSLVFAWSYARSGVTPDFKISQVVPASEKLDAKSLTTHRFPLDEINSAFAAALDKGISGAVKVLVIP